MIENREKQEKVILMAAVLGNEEETLVSLEELEELIHTAGAEAVGAVIQNRDQIHPGTYLGKGKLEEIREMIWETGADGVVCDDELTPAQMGNLEDILQVKIMDRTMVILDIFAHRASTSEGKLQVELAQLRYRSSRLTGLGKSLSRLGGGIGTRGPGEKKLETDRRLIRTRITHLKEELEEVKRHREVTRNERQKHCMKTAAIVGYTNAGKSTLLNALTGAGVLEEDKLFATLDSTTRNLCLPSSQQILLTDTVGFIRKLPHHLIDAFRSTLEETKYADIIVHVVDASSPHAEEQMHIVYETLQQLGVENKPIITLLNKQDLIPEASDGVQIRDFRADRVIPCSVKKGDGLREFLEALEDQLRSHKTYFEQVLDYKDAGKIRLIRDQGELLSEEYREDGILVKAYVPQEILYRF